MLISGLWVKGDLKAQYTLLVKLLEKEFIFMPGQTDQVSVNLRSPGPVNNFFSYVGLGLPGLN